MSRIDELIGEHCPNGVEHRTLGDIARLVRGNGMPRKDLTASGVGAIHYGDIYTRYGLWTTETLYFVSRENAERLARVDPGDLIVTNTSENLDDVGKAVAWLGKESIVTGGHATVLKHDQDAKFLAYWFSARSFDQQKRSLAGGTKVIDISAKKLAKLRVPIPPLTVQREIVRVLDDFAELEGELEAELRMELEARHQQLSSYRTRLLDPDDDVPVVELGRVAEFKYGHTAKAAATGTHRFLRITDITSRGKLSSENAKYVDYSDPSHRFIVEAGDLLVARTGGTYGKTMLVDAVDPAVYASFLIRIRFPDKSISPAYYWHFAQSRSYWDQANALVSTGGQPQFNANVLKLVRVPIPLPSEQERIVRILDRFDALVNDLSIDLRGEIAARRKQYEYFRDQLLTFEETR